MIKKTYLFVLFVIFLLIQYCYVKIVDKGTETIKENHKMEYSNSDNNTSELTPINKVLILEEPKINKKKEEQYGRI